jgi:putative hydrolase of the HAD superfamily
LTSKIGEVEAVIFDLDETLIDAQQGLKAAHERVADLLQKFLEEKNVTVERSTLEKAVEQVDDEMNRGSSYNRNLWWQKILDKIGSGKTLSEPHIERITTEYWKAYEDAGIPYPDTISTLEYLKKEEYRLGILTDDDGIVGFKRRRILSLSFKDFFDATIVAGDEISESKTSPLPFLLIADKLGTSPRRCVVVGDKPFTDIKGGKSAGMITVHVARRRWDSPVEADYQITTLSELRTLL